ncbi:hypothetical protein D3C81_2270440 [compost metagenome]
MRAKQEDFIVAHDDVGFLELHASGADGFGFPTLQYDAGLEALLDEVIVECFSVVNNAHEFRLGVG